MKFAPFAFGLSCALLLLATIPGCQTAKEAESSTPPASSHAPAGGGSAGGLGSVSIDASGWVTTASGLRYQALAAGPATGESPTTLDSVTVHYRGTLTNGTVFDSSIDRGQPATFGVGQVIPGWTEALQLMKPGDKWMLYIPARLAYGNRPMGDKIPAGSDLIFEVQLLQVNR